MNPKPPYIEIAVQTPLRRTFHYRAPEGKPTPVRGVRCRVPFGRRRVMGIVVGSSDRAPVADARIRAISEILDEAPVLPPRILELCEWAAGYYHHPIGEAIATALPVLLRQGDPLHEREAILRTSPEGQAADPASLSRAPRQAALLRLLQSRPDGLTRAELSAAEFGRGIVDGLVGKNMAAWEESLAGELNPPPPGAARRETPPALNPDQARVVEEIAARGAGTSLLYGVTGSGKTEVYLRLIERSLAEGRQALVLVPEIALTPQTIDRFSRRFETPVVALHSNLTVRQRLDGWRRASSGQAGIIIGTRSAVYTPLFAPGIIVVDEEHDSSFKQQDGFRYHARDVAVMRGHLEKIPVVLGSATPSLESFHNAWTQRYGLSQLPYRAGGARPPRFEVVNVRREPLQDGFARRVVEAMGARLAQGEQVLVFRNRRGFSPVLLCPDCAWTAECNRCDAKMTLHRATRSLICHHCGSSRAIDSHCPSCGGTSLMPVGEGTQRLEDVLGSLFPDVPVIRIDRDSTRPRHAMENFMAEITSGRPALLVGTQMLAKGHHFPNVTLVVIKDMDAAFYSANYKSEELTAQLIMQVGGRAGREAKPGTVAIETCIPHQPLFTRLLTEGYPAFAEGLLEDRRQHELPPFRYHALLRAEATKKTAALEFLDDIGDQLRPFPSVDVLGPVAAGMERRAGKYRGQLLLAADNRRPLHHALGRAIGLAEASPRVRQVRWSVDVDPVDLF